MNKELEEAIDICKNIICDEVIGTYCIEIQKNVNCSENCKNNDCYLTNAIETVLNYIENSIPKKKVEEKIEENNKLIEECRDDEEHCGEIYLYEHDNKILQELLEVE